MSWLAQTWARRRGGLEIDLKGVLMLMADDADLNFECEIQVTDLALECKRNRKTVERYLATLVTEGYITKVQVGNQHQYTRYRLNVSYDDAGDGVPHPTPQEVSALQLAFEELLHERVRLGLDPPHLGGEAPGPAGGHSQIAPSSPVGQSQIAPSSPVGQPQIAPSSPAGQPQITPSSPADSEGQSQIAPSSPAGQPQIAPSSPADSEGQPQIAPSSPAGQLQITPSSPAGQPQIAPSSPADAEGQSQITPSSPAGQPQITPSSPAGQSQITPSSPAGQLQITPSSPVGHPQIAPSSPADSEGQSQIAPSSPLINNNINNKNNYLIKGLDLASDQTTLPGGFEQIATLPGYRPRDGDQEFIDRVVLRCREENVAVAEMVAVAVRYLEASGRVPGAGHPLRFLSKTVDVQIDQVKRGQGRRVPRESERSGRLYTAEMYPQQEDSGYRTGDEDEDGG